MTQLKQGQKVRVTCDRGNNFSVGDIVEYVRPYLSRGGAYLKGVITNKSDLRYRDGVHEQALDNHQFVAIETIDFTRPLQTKSGKPVTIITTEARAEGYPVLAYIGTSTSPFNFTADGKYFRDGTPSGNDLQNVLEDKFVYVNVYNVGGKLEGSGRYDSREQADRMADASRVGCNKFKLEANRFDA